MASKLPALAVELAQAAFTSASTKTGALRVEAIRAPRWPRAMRKRRAGRVDRRHLGQRRQRSAATVKPPV